MNDTRQNIFDQAKRVVVKVGSGVLTADHHLNIKAIRSVSRQISRLMDKGTDVILVSSGAMASGVAKVGFSCHPHDNTDQRK